MSEFETIDQSSMSDIERLISGLSSTGDIVQSLTSEVYAGLQVYCNIPAGYRHCELAEWNIDIPNLTAEEVRWILENPPGQVVNPEAPHKKTMELFRMIMEGHELVCENGDPMRPIVGAYLYGPPGVGKTHIMAAFGRIIEATLKERLSDVMQRIGSHIEIFRRQYEISVSVEKKTVGDNVWNLDGGGLRREVPPEVKFAEAMNGLKRILAGNRDQPTDMLYLGFEDLCALYGDPGTRQDALHALETAPYVFVDDIHGKGDPQRLMVIQRLIERRYEQGKFGTFLTTNIDVEHLGGEDHNIASRIMSRTKESFVFVNFEGCKDWRQEVKGRRVKLIEEAIEARLAERDMQAEETPVQENPA